MPANDCLELASDSPTGKAGPVRPKHSPQPPPTTGRAELPSPRVGAPVASGEQCSRPRGDHNDHRASWTHTPGVDISSILLYTRLAIHAADTHMSAPSLVTRRPPVRPSSLCLHRARPARSTTCRGTVRASPTVCRSACPCQVFSNTLHPWHHSGASIPGIPASESSTYKRPHTAARPSEAEIHVRPPCM